MGGTLVVAELGDGQVKRSTHSAITFAREVGGPYSILVLGDGVAAPAKELSAFGAQKVLVADDPSLAHALAERFAPTVAQVARQGGWDTVVVAATTFGKDLAPRVAAKLSAGYAPDVDRVKVEGGKRSYRRPQYAGNALGWLEIATATQVVSVRQTEFVAAEPSGGISPVESVAKAADDPAAARVVVSGGRSLKEQFKQVLEPLADALGAAIGASRAACDAGYAAPELQVGQTGRTVAPQLYVAVGISGAIQHIAGMKSSKYIVAINKDPDAPIFQIADYGVVADLFVAVPELVKELKAPG